MHATTPAASPADGLLPKFADVVRSEFCRLRTVRSTFWALLAAVGFNVVTAALLSFFPPGYLSTRQQATIDPPGLASAGCACPRSPSACSACWLSPVSTAPG